MFGILTRLFAGTLRRQLIIGVTLTIATIMSLFVWDVTRQQQAENLQQHEKEAVALATSVAASTTEWVASRDFSGLQEIVHNLSHYPDLRHAIVLDIRGQVLAHSDPALRGLYLKDLPQKSEVTILKQTSNLVDVASPIMLADRHIGWVRIGLSRDSLDAQLAKMTRDGIICVDCDCPGHSLGRTGRTISYAQAL
jgi:uncharacterized membrane protein affecting hemolysin expression